MDDHGSYNITFGDTTGDRGGNVHQIAVANYFSAPQTRSALLDEFGPVDPDEERLRIISQKDEPLEASCSWIFEDGNFERWLRGDEDASVFCIHGEPGKGKTILVEVILRELSARLDQQKDAASVAFFFCQRSDNRLNSAVGILRALIYSLVRHSPICCKYLETSYHIRRDNTLDSNLLFWRLWATLKNIIDHVSISKFYFCIDALDECLDNYEMLDRLSGLRLSSKVSWLITCRNEPKILGAIGSSKSCARTSLEDNRAFVDNAVQQFIDAKVDHLAKTQRYDQSLVNFMKNHLSTNAEGTFLWVALVCQRLERVNSINARGQLLDFPPGLHSLYGQMLTLVVHQPNSVEANLCQNILRTVATLYGPVKLKDIGYLCDLPITYLEDPAKLERLVSQCASFLVIRNDKLYFVHQTALDFLRNQNDTLFPHGAQHEHRIIAGTLLSILWRSLKRDICSTRDPSVLVKDLDPDSLQTHIPSHVEYACRFWIHHFNLSLLFDQASASNRFLELQEFLKQHYLHWVECLSWLQCLSSGLLGLQALEQWVEATKLNDQFLSDAYRFLATFRGIVEKTPLQIYFSALVFSPQQSLVKENFSAQWPCWLSNVPYVERKWGIYRRIYESRSTLNGIKIVKISPDGLKIACGTSDGEVLAWDLLTGDVIGQLQATCAAITHLTFSSDSKMLHTVSKSGGVLRSINIIGEENPEMLTSIGDPQNIQCGSVSKNGKFAAFGLNDGYVTICDLESGKETCRFRDNQTTVGFINISPNGQLVACSSLQGVMITVRTTADGYLTAMLPESHDPENSVLFSPNSQLILTDSIEENGISLWDTKTGRETFSISDPSHVARCRSFSPNGKLVALAMAKLSRYLEHHQIALIDTETGTSFSNLEYPVARVTALEFSPDSTILVSGSDQELVVWDITTKAIQYKIRHGYAVPSLTFSPNGYSLAVGGKSAIGLCSVKVDLAKGGQDDNTHHKGTVTAVTISHSGKLAASGSDERTLILWDLNMEGEPVVKKKQDCLYTPWAMRFFPCDKRLAILSSEGLIIHDVPKGEFKRCQGSSSGIGSPIILGFSTRLDLVALFEIGKDFSAWDPHSWDGVYAYEVDKALLKYDPEAIASFSWVTLNKFASPPTTDLSFSTSYQWITWKEQKLLLLPAETWPLAQAVCTHQNTIMLGGSAGRVSFFKFDTERLSLQELISTRPLPLPGGNEGLWSQVTRMSSKWLGR